jgi:hypothetical protein
VAIALNLENKMNHNKVLLIPALVFALIIQACSSNTVVVSTPTNIMVIVPTAATPPGTPQINPVQFGSNAIADDMKFVITGTVRPADGIVSSGDMFNAQPGQYQQYIFVTLDVTCETTADQQCHLDVFKMKLLVSDGVLKYPKWFISGVEGILKDTDFNGGTTISGYVPFIISIGDSGLLLIYEALSGDVFYLSLP